MENCVGPARLTSTFLTYVSALLQIIALGLLVLDQILETFSTSDSWSIPGVLTFVFILFSLVYSIGFWFYVRAFNVLCKRADRELEGSYSERRLGRAKTMKNVARKMFRFQRKKK